MCVYSFSSNPSRFEFEWGAFNYQLWCLAFWSSIPEDEFSIPKIRAGQDDPLAEYPTSRMWPGHTRIPRFGEECFCVTHVGLSPWKHRFFDFQTEQSQQRG